MKKFLITLLLLLTGFANAQWEPKSPVNGLYTSVFNTAPYLERTTGLVSGSILYSVNSEGDTSKYEPVYDMKSGLYKSVLNKDSMLGIAPRKVQAQNIYIMNLDELLGSYLAKSDTISLISTKQNVLNQIWNYVGDTTYVGHTNHNENITGRWTFSDLTTFNDTVKIGSTSLFYLNGSLNANTTLKVSDTLSGSSVVASVGYFIGATRVVFTTSNNLNINSRASNDLLLGTGTAGSIWTFQSALGNVVYAPVSLTGSLATPIFDIAQTWNTSGTPTAFKMNITNTASNAGSLLMDLQLNSTSLLSFSRVGRLSVIGAPGFNATLQIGTNGTIENASAVLTYTSAGTTILGAHNFTLAANQTATSGYQKFMGLTYGFAPTSGTATNNGIDLVQTINQTGGANGITRGLYINPTLTSAYDFRAIEVASGKSVFQDVVANSSSKGFVLLSADGHYWRITVSNGGVISTADLGTTLRGF